MNGKMYNTDTATLVFKGALKDYERNGEGRRCIYKKQNGELFMAFMAEDGSLQEIYNSDCDQSDFIEFLQLNLSVEDYVKFIGDVEE